MAASALVENWQIFPFIFLGGVLPALFWLWFWLHEDQKSPEPRGKIAETFVLGALAVIPAYFIERAVGNTWPLAQNLLLVVFLWSLIEEGLKYLAVYVGALSGRNYDEPVDAMMYMITGALGFAALENMLFMLGAINADGSSSLSFLITGNFRFIGASVVHIVASGLVGGFVGLGFYKSPLARLVYFLLGLSTAVGLHALFNYTIIQSNGSGVLKIFALLWLTALLIILLFERVKATQRTRDLVNTI